jgi:hypothetical protein
MLAEFLLAPGREGQLRQLTTHYSCLLPGELEAMLCSVMPCGEGIHQGWSLLLLAMLDAEKLLYF